MVEIFKIGYFSIYLFGITITLGMILGTIVMLREAKRKKLYGNELLDLAIYTIAASVVSARLYYVLVFNFSYYLKHPIEIFFVRNGGLSIQGGLIGGIVFTLFYTKKKDINFWKAADAFAPGIILGQAIGRIGCDVFGIPMKKGYLWGVNLNSQIVHPVQIYELLLDLILFTYLWRKRDKTKYEGQLFIIYIIGFSLIRGAVEFFRDNPIVFGSLSVAHITSFIIIGFAFFINNKIKNNNINYKNSESNKIKVSFIEYMIILFIGISGTSLYYYIH
ncbi:prolipoprotein diacylglyceryl transferase [Tepidibacter mesophilus]|uniref:prolipoprotein diacylglyceryl transferase n=1 Tax=Tepidibacter mesophilus TaxID=655607 RepID=UPI001FA8953E|nr:prolipoprotein diacylglyceryl transferase [Tepidibacter mesophilus]